MNNVHVAPLYQGPVVPSEQITKRLLGLDLSFIIEISLFKESRQVSQT